MIPGDRELLERTLTAALQPRREAEQELIRRAAYKYSTGEEAKIEAIIRYVLSLGDAVKKLADELPQPAPEPSPVETLAKKEPGKKERAA